MPETAPDLSNPAWHSLHGPHQHLGLFHADAARYPAHIAPFAALAASTAAALTDLAALTSPGEQLYLIEDSLPPHPVFTHLSTLPCLELLLPDDLPLPQDGLPQDSLPPPELLTPDDHPDMLALITLAYPGFYRPNTPRMGTYFGIRDAQGTLVAMGGERLRPHGTPEISGIATHPEHRGHGHATRLLWHLVRHHRDQGLRSFLHVASANHAATALYHRLGFQTVAAPTLHHLRRQP